jgi:hypothetical protein
MNMRLHRYDTIIRRNIQPKLSTIEDYANAVGYKIKISFEPVR